ncbi:MAG: hypothetical protein RR009_06820 [Oscillospiraceae bacterium]
MAELGEINYGHLFVDGTKTEANANKYETRVNLKLENSVLSLCSQYGILTRAARCCWERIAPTIRYLWHMSVASAKADFNAVYEGRRKSKSGFESIAA